MLHRPAPKRFVKNANGFMTENPGEKMKAIDRVLRGRVVCILSKESSPKEARIYAVQESRGYQTDYRAATFFYFVSFSENKVPTYCCGITNDQRRHNFIERCKEQNTTVHVINQELFDKWAA